MEESIFVPISFFGLILGLVWLVQYYAQMKRRTAHETIRLAIEKGQAVSPDMIERMSQIGDPRTADIRRAVLWTAIGIGIAAIALILPIDDFDGIRGVLAGAVFPFAIGIAYFGLWAFGHARRDH